LALLNYVRLTLTDKEILTINFSLKTILTLKHDSKISSRFCFKYSTNSTIMSQLAE